MAQYRLRYMHLTDISQVVYLDKLCFPMPWSTRSYAYEVKESSYSHMLILEQATAVPPTGRLATWWAALTGRSREQTHILAYGGLWHFGANAHVSTIASNPNYRRQGYGELALLAMLRRAVWIGAAEVTLEVRVSNAAAQMLYTKYGFETRSTKHGYYHDNDEDAYDMALNLLNAQHTRQIESRYRAFRQVLSFEDTYTHVSRPVV